MTGELRVRTCINCGADTVDSRGICQNCGWSESDRNSSSPSLGETRAAQIPMSPTDNRGMATSSRLQTNVAPQYPFERTVDMPRNTPPVSPTRSGASGPNMGGTQGGTSRYCGTCGARIEPGEVFCGQCGTPVGAGGNSLGAYSGGRSSGSGRYRMEDDDDVWSPGQGDALTEAIPPAPMPAQFGRGVVSSPYS